jgi:hypothetical protein
MMLTPPGAKVHAFGDGSETKPDPRVFHAFAQRMVNPRANWYQSKLGGIEDGMAVLEAPYPMPIAGNTVFTPPSNEAYYPSTGWVAIHSDIGVPTAPRFYFKSSPYGSFNHSHGDQNGLLLSVAGQPLLVKAGWYDWYGSPLWTDWYHQTKSQNAVTFDGGKGQLVDGYREQLQRNGKITGWSVNAAYDYAEGDATPAYGGQLTMAKRQIWYLKAQNAMLVRDKLSAVVPHTYEFNIHAPVAMTVESPSSVKIAINGQSVCLRDLNGNAPFATWTGPAPKAGVTESHGAFYLKNDGKSVGEFLVLMDVGCKRPTVKVAASGTTRSVTVGARPSRSTEASAAQAPCYTRRAGRSPSQAGAAKDFFMLVPHDETGIPHRRPQGSRPAERAGRAAARRRFPDLRAPRRQGRDRSLRGAPGRAPGARARRRALGLLQPGAGHPQFPAQIVAEVPDFDKVLFLSAQDFPLLSNPALKAALAACAGMNCSTPWRSAANPASGRPITATSISTATRRQAGAPGLLAGEPGDARASASGAGSRQGMRPWGGSSWWALSRDCVRSCWSGCGASPASCAFSAACPARTRCSSRPW